MALALKIWPAFLYVSIIWLSPDFLIPILRFTFSSDALILYIVVLPLASVELYYGYWFWGHWIRYRVAELEKVREVQKQLKQDGWLDRWVVDYILAIYHSIIDPNSKILKKINKWGPWFIWLMAVFVPPGFAVRSGCAACCGLFRLKRYFCHLFLANLVHTILMVQVWNWVLGK